MNIILGAASLKSLSVLSRVLSIFSPVLRMLFLEKADSVTLTVTRCSLRNEENMFYKVKSSGTYRLHALGRWIYLVFSMPNIPNETL